MNDRDTLFRRKFEGAANIFGVNRNEVISLKIRDTISNYQDYTKFFTILSLITDIDTKPIKANLNGNGYLVSSDDHKIIVVEHESGIEILYIAGSVASLIGLIPLIITIWKGVRKEIDFPRYPGSNRMEIRRFDNKDKLHEINDIDLSFSTGLPITITPPYVKTSLKKSSEELKKLSNQLKLLNNRIAKLERKRENNITSRKRKGNNKIKLKK